MSSTVTTIPKRLQLVLGFSALLAIFGCAPAHAQYVYMLTGFSTQFGSPSNPTVDYGSIGGGLVDVEVDYDTHFYYYPQAAGYLSVNGSLVASQVGPANDTNNEGCYYVGTQGWCQPIWQNFPQPIAHSTTYEVQLNAYVIPYYTYTQSNVTYYEDYFGYSLLGPESLGGSGDDGANVTCFDDALDGYPACADTTQPIWIDSVYFGLVTPGEPVPTIGGIQVNGVNTTNIMQGTSGYMAIYGTYLDGASAVTVAGSGITITSFQYYSTGANGASQINAYFQAAPSATTGSHQVTVNTGHGQSNPSPVNVVPPP